MTCSKKCSVFVHALRIFFGAGFSLLYTVMSGSSFVPSDAKSIYPSYKNKKFLTVSSDEFGEGINVTCTLERKLCRYWFVSARVTRGNMTLLGLNVTVLIKIPDGRIISQKLLYPQPSDSVLLDGVYGTYITRHSIKGAYQVTVSVSIKGQFLELDRTSYDLNVREGYYQRSEICGEFLLDEEFNEDVDNFPPATIHKLVVSSVDLAASTVTFHWVAPGDDFYEGTVKRYELTMISKDQNSSIGTTFKLTLIPKPAGELEKLTVTIPRFPTLQVVNLSLSACDESGKCSRSLELSVAAVCNYSRNYSEKLLNYNDSLPSTVANTVAYLTTFINFSKNRLEPSSKLDRCSSGNEHRPVWVVHRTEEAVRRAPNCDPSPYFSNGDPTSLLFKKYLRHVLDIQWAQQLKHTHNRAFTKRRTKLTKAYKNRELKLHQRSETETNKDAMLQQRSKTKANETLTDNRKVEKRAYKYRLPFIPRLRISKRFNKGAEENEVETTLKMDIETITTQIMYDESTASPNDDSKLVPIVEIPVQPRNEKHEKPISIKISDPSTVTRSPTQLSVHPLDVKNGATKAHDQKSTTKPITTTISTTSTTTRKPTTTSTRTTTRKPTTTTTRTTTRRTMPPLKVLAKSIPKPNRGSDLTWPRTRATHNAPKRTRRPRPLRKFGSSRSNSRRKQIPFHLLGDTTIDDVTDYFYDPTRQPSFLGDDFLAVTRRPSFQGKVFFAITRRPPFLGEDLDTTFGLRYFTELTTNKELNTFAFDRRISETSTSPTTNGYDPKGRQEEEDTTIAERQNFTIYVKPKIWRSERTWWWLLAACFFLAGCLKLVAFALIVVCLNFWLLKRGLVYDKKDRPIKRRKPKKKKKEKVTAA